MLRTAPHDPPEGPAVHPFDRLRARVAAFVDARDWQQFHSPKNLAMCLSVEAGELLELYLWSREGPGPHPPGAGPPERARIAEEAADVLISLLNFAAATDLDLPAVALAKLEALERKYPVEQARGSAVKGSALAGAHARAHAEARATRLPGDAPGDGAADDARFEER